MKRTEFEHAIRAAASILGTSELMVIGSQALHATVSDGLPEAAERSIEVDVVALDDEDGRKADLIDGSIGEASMFHATFGYYAQGVSESTAVLPEGWRDRMVRFETPATNGAVACTLLRQGTTPHLWRSPLAWWRRLDATCICQKRYHISALD